jgi:oligopeptide transport system ATP-binding protein
MYDDNSGKDLIRVVNLVKYYPVRSTLFSHRRGFIQAVKDVSFEINRGETLGLVGESGCGKSTIGNTILMLDPPTSGDVYFKNININRLNRKDFRALGYKMQMIFQDPYSSLDPRMTVAEIVSEPLIEHHFGNKKLVRQRVEELLELVGMKPEFANRYPHEFSGGQRQRIGIARAISLDPDFIVCDEPISALDVSIKAQVVNLLQDLQRRFGLTYLFIAHDLSIVRHISDRIAVMYLGKIVELTDKKSLYSNPLHPYTQALLAAVPIPDPLIEELRKYTVLEGEIPSADNPPVGCYFNTRCPYAEGLCFKDYPDLEEIYPGHIVACFKALDLKH